MELNLPLYNHKLRTGKKGKEIFDPVRQKYVVCTPEEWVRQNFIQYLVNEKNVPQALIIVEGALKVNTLSRRSDIVVYNRKAKPLLAVECKAQTVKITQEVFNQLARYNLTLQVPYLIVTNGQEHYCCQIDFENNSYIFLRDIPDFEKMNDL